MASDIHPTTIYRYLSDNALVATLRSQTLRFANPRTWPDPMDCGMDFLWQMTSPSHISKLAVEATQRYCNNMIDHSRSRSAGRTSLIDALEKTDGSFKAVQAVLTTTLQQNTSIDVITNQKNIADDTRGHYRILCCSLNPRSMAMWGSYAIGRIDGKSRGHMGGMLHLDRAKVFASTSFLGGQLQYFAQYPPTLSIDEAVELLFYGTHRPDLRTLVHYATMYKAAEWAYEHEYRMVAVMPPSERDQEEKFIKIPEGGVTDISLGAFCPDDTVETVISLCSAWTKPPSIYRAKLYARQFSMHPMAELLWQP